jgi:hypothetical protein
MAILIAGSFLMFMNWAIVIVRVAKKRSSSLAPPLGGLCVMISFWILPSSNHFWPNRLRSWSWIALFLDPATLAMIYTLLYFASGRRPKAPNS